MIAQVTHLVTSSVLTSSVNPTWDPRGKSMFTVFFGLPGRLDFQLWTKGLSIVKCHVVSVKDGLGKEGSGTRRPAVSRRKCLGTNEASTPEVEQRRQVGS